MYSLVKASSLFRKRFICLHYPNCAKIFLFQTTIQFVHMMYFDINLELTKLGVPLITFQLQRVVYSFREAFRLTLFKGTSQRVVYSFREAFRLTLFKGTSQRVVYSFREAFRLTLFKGTRQRVRTYSLEKSQMKSIGK